MCFKIVRIFANRNSIIMLSIHFANKKLKKCATDEKYGKRELGTIRFNKFVQRIDELSSCDTLEDARCLPGHHHELKEDRKGFWACDLDQPYRLIYRPCANPIPTDKDGKSIWIEIDEIELTEITNYHGK